ncbi:MAG: DUF4450 domain-containing protein [Rikenellaceae bacterium]|nr:DUF4450 domain-containing protein [Rikenellaceae bacterium]
MNIKFLLPLLGLTAFIPGPARMAAQPPKPGYVIDSFTFNQRQSYDSRTLQYRPDGEDFVAVNGKNRYTRALYGSHTEFRIETSDRPVFAAYGKVRNKNISFRVAVPGQAAVALDSTAFCESRYTPGRRTYRLTDPSWGDGEINISVLAFFDSEGGIWKIESTGMPEGTELWAGLTGIRAERLNRNGDMGADPADSFEAPVNPVYSTVCRWDVGGSGTVYMLLENLDISEMAPAAGAALYDRTEEARKALVSRVRFETPDPYINPIGGALVAAGDGIWDGQVWLHGAIGWRMPLPGWRAAYTGNFLGWHDRAKIHFDGYAASQVTDVPNTIPHPTQDPELNLARAIKEWGTPMYSNGYIARTPNDPTGMNHYDMNLAYIDELLWHFQWTGDWEYAREMWPVLQRHLAWEKLNFDPDDDGLYDAYACFWASDAVYYNSGGVTLSSAYNYRANKLAAQIAERIGEDPEPYRREAEKILAAINTRLWMEDKGHWAEFQDFIGHQRLHESSAIWTIYHAIDSDIADPFQAYRATRYVDSEIPHFPVRAAGLEDGGYETISTTNWMPYAWSVNNVAFAEVWHMALAYFQAGRNDEGFKLLKSSVLDGMYIGNSPGNFGQISFYDAARGETYRDFGDPVGVASRVFIQGLYGINPDALNDRLVIRPGFPSEWPHASLETTDVSYSFVRGADDGRDVYTITHNLGFAQSVDLRVRAYHDRIRQVTVNGQPVEWTLSDAVAGYPLVSVFFPTKPGMKYEVTIEWAGDPIVTEPVTGNRTRFEQVTQGDMSWWKAAHYTVEPEPVEYSGLFENVVEGRCEPVPMDNLWNSSVADIFTNEYLTPRSPYTTLQIPTQGIGEWCHATFTAVIDDSGLRSLVRDGVLETSLGVPFRSPGDGNNIAYTSLWDNYPDRISVPLDGKASRAYLLMAGSTNQMQSRILNGTVTFTYTDGSTRIFELTNPYTWCPIEQDFYVDDYAFRVDGPRPYRLHLKDGKVAQTLSRDPGIVYFPDIECGAALLLDIELNAGKELKEMTVETIANEVVIGLMGVTLQR